MGTMTKWPVQKHTEHHKHGVYKDASLLKGLIDFVRYDVTYVSVFCCTHRDIKYYDIQVVDSRRVLVL